MRPARGYDEPLPRIPPFGLMGGIEARSERLDGRLEVRWVAEQDRVADLELPTDDYLLLNLRLAWRPVPDRADLSLTFDARNLLDEEARNHVSYLKDRVPLPGRDFRFSVRFDL
jgi:iron complex outermembrane receptor protein